MAAEILDGKAIAGRMQEETAARVAELASNGVQPHLAAVQLGEPAASRVYTRFQARACESVGIEYELKVIPPDVSQEDLFTVIDRLNARDDITGIILQMPLPGHINTREACNRMDPAKDVEGMHAVNYGRLFSATGHVAPCTALAAVELIKSSGIGMGGAEAVIVGHSEIVGKPISMLLLQSPTEAPTVTVCHIATRDLAAHTRRADILIVAAGTRQRAWDRYSLAMRRAAHSTNPEAESDADVALSPPKLEALVSADMIKPGAVVIDVATNRIPREIGPDGQPALNADGKPDLITVGDVDFDTAREVAGFITPVPGGVGPVTVQMLLRNTVACAVKQQVKTKD